VKSIVEAIVELIKKELPQNYKKIRNVKIHKKKCDWNLKVWIKR